MDILGWLLSMRRKPVMYRQKFVAVFAIATMAGVTFIWFIFFFTGLSDRLKTEGSPTGSSTPQSAASLLQKPF